MASCYVFARLSTNVATDSEEVPPKSNLGLTMRNVGYSATILISLIAETNIHPGSHNTEAPTFKDIHILVYA